MLRSQQIGTRRKIVGLFGAMEAACLHADKRDFDDDPARERGRTLGERALEGGSIEAGPALRWSGEGGTGVAELEPTTLPPDLRKLAK